MFVFGMWCVGEGCGLESKLCGCVGRGVDVWEGVWMCR